MYEMNLNIELNLKVTQEDVDDIMSTALDGGITYWADKVEVVGDYLGEFASEQISRGGKLRIHDWDEREWHELDLDGFTRGIEEFARTWVAESNVFKTDVEGFLRLDVGNIDAPMADTIIQYALF